MSSILVTGATGTLGRALLQFCFSQPRRWTRVIAFSRDEVKQAQLHEEFGHHPALRLFLGDVRDEQRLQTALRGVDVVIHAAALKRVDAGAYSPSEMIRTNIMGTMNVVNAAIQQEVGRVIMVSSDKAVQATNIYGATKFCAETYAVQANSYAHRGATKVAAVRYGNVLGSRGSVVHTWRGQVQRGVPITLTHGDMTRFIMTIEQAVDLIWFAVQNAVGGEVFLPVLPSAKMADLAAAIAPSGDYPIQTVGLRPGGEKMAESLLNEEEPTRTYRAGDYYVVTPSHHDWSDGLAWQRAAGDRWLPSGFEYRSDRNDAWLSAVQLREWMTHTATCRV